MNLKTELGELVGMDDDMLGAIKKNLSNLKTMAEELDLEEKSLGEGEGVDAAQELDASAEDATDTESEEDATDENGEGKVVTKEDSSEEPDVATEDSAEGNTDVDASADATDDDASEGDDESEPDASDDSAVLKALEGIQASVVAPLFAELMTKYVAPLSEEVVMLRKELNELKESDASGIRGLTALMNRKSMLPPVAAGTISDLMATSLAPVVEEDKTVVKSVTKVDAVPNNTPLQSSSKKGGIFAHIYSNGETE